MSDLVRHVTLVRHPETEANVESRYIGRSDSPLSPRGLRQRAWLGAALAPGGADAVYSSPLPRALTTARCVAPEGAPVHVLADLEEIDFGDAEGLTFAEIGARGIRLDYTGAGPIAPGGEHGDGFDLRVRRAAAEIASGAERSIVVTHGGVMRRLLVCWLGLPLDAGWSFGLPNATCAMIRLTGGRGVLESLTPPPDLSADRG